MGLFNRNKKHKNIEKTDESQNWNKALKRNIINKTGSIQQGFKFDKNIDTIVSKPISRSKKGLSYTIQDIGKDQVEILKKCSDENTATELMKFLKRTNKTKFKQNILDPLIYCGFFELTIPEKPTSPKQKYRLTGKFVRKTAILSDNTL